MKINDLAPSKKTKLVIFIVRSDDKCLTLTASVTRFNLDIRLRRIVNPLGKLCIPNP
jgi:hypothetical protein